MASCSIFDKLGGGPSGEGSKANVSLNLSVSRSGREQLRSAAMESSSQVVALQADWGRRHREEDFEELGRVALRVLQVVQEACQSHAARSFIPELQLRCREPSEINGRHFRGNW